MASLVELRRYIGRTAAGGLIIAGMGLADCAPNFISPQSSAERGRPTETLPIRDFNKEALFAAVETLPVSPLQQAVLSCLHRYYGNPQPTSVSYGDLSFQIISAKVTIDRKFDPDGSGVEGFFTLRKNIPTTNVLSAANELKFFVPLNDLLLEDEINQLPKEFQGPNNTLLYPFNFPVGGKFVEVIEPVISINSYESPRKFFTSKEQQDLIKMALVKEACSLALEDIFITNVTKNMHVMNLPTHIDALTNNGDRVNASPLVEAMALLSTNKGRFTSSLDLGGYLLMFKLMAGTEVEEAYSKIPYFPEAITAAKQFNLPSDSNGLFAASVRWVNSSPVSQKLGYVGNFSLIP